MTITSGRTWARRVELGRFAKRNKGRFSASGRHGVELVARRDQVLDEFKSRYSKDPLSLAIQRAVRAVLYQAAPRFEIQIEILEAIDGLDIDAIFSKFPKWRAIQAIKNDPESEYWAAKSLAALAKNWEQADDAMYTDPLDGVDPEDHTWRELFELIDEELSQR